METLFELGIGIVVFMGAQLLTDWVKSCMPESRAPGSRVRDSVNEKFTAENRALARKYYGCQYPDEKK